MFSGVVADWYYASYTARDQRVLSRHMPTCGKLIVMMFIVAVRVRNAYCMPLSQSRLRVKFGPFIAVDNLLAEFPMISK